MYTTYFLFMCHIRGILFTERKPILMLDVGETVSAHHFIISWNSNYVNPESETRKQFRTQKVQDNGSHIRGILFTERKPILMLERKPILMLDVGETVSAHHFIISWNSNYVVERKPILMLDVGGKQFLRIISSRELAKKNELPKKNINHSSWGRGGGG